MHVRLALVTAVAALSLSLAPAGRGLLPAAVLTAIEEIEQDELRAHVTYLASDALAGRGIRQKGNAEAEAYLAGALEAAGVVPVLPGYRQPFDIYTPRLEGEPSLVVTAGDGTTVTELALGPDFHPLRGSAPGQGEGPVVFAGYGLSAPDWRHDDYRRLDARGAIVLALDGLPPAIERLPGRSPDEKAALGTAERKIATARAHGAAGLLLIRAYPGAPSAVWSSGAVSRAFAEWRLQADAEAGVPAAVISAERAGPIRRALARRIPLTAALRPAVAAHPYRVHNILGMLPGRDEGAGIVVLGAHFDHDGTDEAGHIYNGADDNASGTAAVLAIARSFARAALAGVRPARTVVFALWNAEEVGLLGAEFFARAPLPRGPVAAKINLDMIGRSEEIDPDDPRLAGFPTSAAGENADTVHLLGYSYAPDLARNVNRANTSGRLTVKTAYDEGAQNLLRRSDHWPFLQRGIPAVFLTTGLHPDYHTPADDVERIDFEKLERIAELAGRLTWLTADGPAPRIRRR